MATSMGCGGSPKVEGEVAISQQNLRNIGNAYVESINKKNKVPASRQDLLPYLTGEPDKIFRSENDGEEFVILWGVDHRTYAAAGKQLPVTGYEKTGRGGKRLVLRVSVIFHLTDEEFQKAPFPPGHKAP
jgi:hypothetical protein